VGIVDAWGGRCALWNHGPDLAGHNLDGLVNASRCLRIHAWYPCSIRRDASPQRRWAMVDDDPGGLVGIVMGVLAFIWRLLLKNEKIQGDELKALVQERRPGQAEAQSDGAIGAASTAA